MLTSISNLYHLGEKVVASGEDGQLPAGLGNFTKDGTCPFMPSNSSNGCHKDCDCDADCIFNLLCCSVGCGKQCLQPELAPGRIVNIVLITKLIKKI